MIVPGRPKGEKRRAGLPHFCRSLDLFAENVWFGRRQQSFPIGLVASNAHGRRAFSVELLPPCSPACEILWRSIHDVLIDPADELICRRRPAPFQNIVRNLNTF
jgi:hypothetical protein